jgi:hypothetical protein
MVFAVVNEQVDKTFGGRAVAPQSRPMRWRSSATSQ